MDRHSNVKKIFDLVIREDMQEDWLHLIASASNEVGMSLSKKELNVLLEAIRIAWMPNLRIHLEAANRHLDLLFTP